jgi:hypothetical protein
VSGKFQAIEILVVCKNMEICKGEKVVGNHVFPVLCVGILY